MLFDLADLRRGAVAQTTTDASEQFVLVLASGAQDGTIPALASSFCFRWGVRRRWRMRNVS